MIVVELRTPAASLAGVSVSLDAGKATGIIDNDMGKAETTDG